MTFSKHQSNSMPFIIGVVGHRDLHPGSTDAVQKIVREWFKEFRKNFPFVPLVLASGLAEGADQLVAGVAIEEGVELWAVLPTAIPEYEKDFTNSDVLDNFRRLLELSTKVVNSSVLAGVDENCSSRPMIYKYLSDQLCGLSHVLFAVWDGGVNQLVGGTSEVVTAFTKGKYFGANINLISKPSCGDVFHLNAPREGSDCRSVSSSWIYANPFDRDATSVAHKKFLSNEIFNALTLLNSYFSRVQEVAISSTTSNLPTYLLPASFDWSSDVLLGRLAQWFFVAEGVSGRFVTMHQRALMFVVVCFLGFSLLALSYGGLIDHPWALFVGAILAILAYWVSLAKRQKVIESTFIFTRGLAEILRVAIVWRASGVTEKMSPVVAAADLSCNDSLAIIAKSIDAISVVEEKKQYSQQLANVLEHWVDSQLDYFAGRINKIAYHDSRSVFYSKISTVCVLIAALIYFLTLIIDLCGVMGAREDLAKLTIWSMFAYWSFLSLSALSMAYAQVMGHGDHAEDYRHALSKFYLVKSKAKCTDEANLISLSVELGRACLREVSSWVIQKKRRPIKLPI